MAAVCHKDSGVQLVHGPHGPSLLCSVSGETAPVAATAALQFNNAGWAYVSWKSPEGAEQTAWAKTLLQKKVLTTDGVLYIAERGSTEKKAVAQLQEEFIAKYPELQLQPGDMHSFTVKEAKVPTDGQSLWWELRQWQEPLKLT